MKKINLFFSFFRNKFIKWSSVCFIFFLNFSAYSQVVEKQMPVEDKSAGQKWATNGNVVNDADFIGTNNNKDLNFRTSKTLRMTISKDGQFYLKNNVFITGTLTASSFAGSGMILLKADNNGLVQKLPFTGNPMHVLKGDGTFGYVSSQTPFDSIHVSNFLKIGNTIYIGNVLPGADNSLYSDGGPLLIQCKLNNNENTIINWNNSGFVGIGTNNPQKKLHVKHTHEGGGSTPDGSIRIEDEYPELGFSSTWDISPTAFNAPPDGYITQLNIGTPAKKDIFKIMETGVVYIGGNNITGRLIVTGGGIFGENIGIGITNAEDKLHVNNGYARIGKDGNYIRLGYNTVNAVIYNEGQGKLLLNYDNGKEVHICTGEHTTADVHIGKNLEVYGNINFKGNIYQNGQPFFTCLWTKSNNDIYYNGSGNTGIGTTTPQDKLHVNDGYARIGRENNYLKIGFNTVNAVIYNEGEGKLLINYNNGKEVHIGTAEPGNPDKLASVHIGKDLYVYNNAGIGTASPQVQLHIKGNGSLPSEIFIQPYNWSSGGDYAGLMLGDQNHYIRTVFSKGTTFYDADYFKFTGGHFRIGDEETSDESNLYVNGNIWAKEVKVRPVNPYSDYVFKPDYRLMTLNETEEYIRSYGHLPGVPSEMEINQQGGINLGDMDNILLKKIEELTLYIIEQNKKIELQQQQINELIKIK